MYIPHIKWDFLEVVHRAHTSHAQYAMVFENARILQQQWLQKHTVIAKVSSS